MKVSKKFQSFFAIVIIANIAMWFYARPLQVEWRNVPPGPSEFSAHAMGYGDAQLAYRLIAFMLQNIGKSDGRTQNLSTYNYEELKKWFFASYDLEPRANYVPMLATYYYGATSVPEQAAHVVDFLRVAGNDPAQQRWRWIVHAIFLARHKMENLDVAYELAEILEGINNPDMPTWTRMMPAFIKNSKGEKEDAYAMLSTMLMSSGANLHPNEVNHIIGYICEQILTPDEAAQDQICTLNKP